MRKKLARLAGWGLGQLLRFVLPEVKPTPGNGDSSSLAARTDELNAAAERYYVERPEHDRAYQLAKPFADVAEFPQYLFNAGVLFHWLRVGPGDTVAEIGAGPCWVSHFLNLYGCRTIALDVSATALALGRERFERDPFTRWDVEPLFLPYDGRRFPLDNGSCDRLVLHDAYHHLPNQEELLTEMARVLKPGGIVAMSEPGRFHSQGEGAQKEVEETGVLENDVVVEDLAALARRCGFTRTTVVPITLRLGFEVEAEHFLDFLAGDRHGEYWTALSHQLLGQHYILLYKGNPVPTTRRPGELQAALRFLRPPPTTLEPTERGNLKLEIRNQGDTRWLGTVHEQAGWTRLGIHLDGPTGYDHNWQRVDLPRDLEPGEVLELSVELRTFPEPGAYRLTFDLVAEHVTWFAERGSKELEVAIEVR